MNPGQFTIHHTRFEYDIVMMKWRRTLRRRARRANKATRYGDNLRRSYTQLFQDNLDAPARADAPEWKPWLERTKDAPSNDHH